MEPTKQQEIILEYTGNAVIIAAPGSGKTFVVSEKIKGILRQLMDHQGIIAISYTNKASNELRERSLKSGIHPKNSFFGTIDKFYISEIIIPFGKQLFGLPTDEVSVCTIDQLEADERNNFNWLTQVENLTTLDGPQLSLLQNYFRTGVLLLETVGILANYIFSHSTACKKYITARYKYIFIDEYQDSGANQHEIFLKITDLQIPGVAVGDLNQSIYAFSGKDSKFLSELTATEGFKLFKLTKNHRCHGSIINYSNYLLDPKTELIPVENNTVHFKRIDGHEVDIARWIDKILDSLKRNYNIEKNSKIAILTRGNRTAGLINANLTTANKMSLTTTLDTNLNIWSAIFSNLLHFTSDKNFKFIEVVEEFTSYDRLSKNNRRIITGLKREVVSLFEYKQLDKQKVAKCFIDIAGIIAPNSANNESIELLNEVLASNRLLDSYKPAEDDELHIMTIHKSKGLEFDAVIHLDLHEWIMPYGQKFETKKNNPSGWRQDLNLHYVAVTRARKACLLVSSTKRTNSSEKIVNGVDSEFLWIDEIKNLRGQKKATS